PPSPLPGVGGDAVPFHPIAGSWPATHYPGRRRTGAAGDTDCGDPRSSAAAGRVLLRTAVSDRCGGRDLPADGRVPRDAGRPAVIPARAYWRHCRRTSVGDHAPRPGLVLLDDLADPARLWIADDGDCSLAERRGWGDRALVRG